MIFVRSHRHVWEGCGHPAETNGRARDLGARITILVAKVIIYPLPLTGPPVSIEFMERAALRTARDQEVETSIRTYLCRHRVQTIRQVLVEARWS